MAQRGKRTRKQLEGVSAADMTPAEYKRSDTPGRYEVTLKGTKIIVSGLHSAKAVAGKNGTYRKIS